MLHSSLGRRTLITVLCLALITLLNTHWTPTSHLSSASLQNPPFGLPSTGGHHGYPVPARGSVREGEETSPCVRILLLQPILSPITSLHHQEPTEVLDLAHPITYRQLPLACSHHRPPGPQFQRPCRWIQRLVSQRALFIRCRGRQCRCSRSQIGQERPQPSRSTSIRCQGARGMVHAHRHRPPV